MQCLEANLNKKRFCIRIENGQNVGSLMMHTGKVRGSGVQRFCPLSHSINILWIVDACWYCWIGFWMRLGSGVVGLFILGTYRSVYI